MEILQMKLLKYTKFILSIAFVSMFYFYADSKIENKPQYEELIEEESQKEEQDFEQSLTTYISKLQFEHPHIVLAQAKLESGNFTSRIYKQNNNMFGMKEPKKRVTVSNGSKGAYAYYDTWMHSVIDQRIYYAKYLDGKTEQQIYTYLENNYAEDKQYVSKLKNIIHKQNLKERFNNEYIVRI